MKNEPRQLDGRVMDKRIEDRIVEPAQGGIRRHAADMDIVSLAHQSVRKCFGIRLGEVAPVVDATYDDEAPRLWLDGKFVGCEDVPDDERTLQISVAAVAAVVRKREFRGREAANGEGLD